MTAPAETLQHEGELTQLLNLYRRHQPRRVLEIGTWQGGTLYHWLRNAPPGAVVVSVDEHQQVGDRAAEWAGDGVKVVLIQGRSQDESTIRAAEAWGLYDWIFIDADHHDQNVRADWHNYRPMVNPGGVVAFHDITPTDDPTIQVAPLWAELVEQHDTLEISVAGGQGIGVVFLPDNAVFNSEDGR